ncbi:unnamed protein product, partial [Durusdinium trenchii]
MRPTTYPSRAFVLGGDGVGQTGLAHLCHDSLMGADWPSSKAKRVHGDGPALLLEDPLGRGPSIELTFVEVPYWWLEADLKTCVQSRGASVRNDCGILLVDVSNPDSFKAALTRSKWAMSAGLQCQIVLSFWGPCGEGTTRPRAVQAESLEWLADEVSVVKPGHFDCTHHGSASFQVELFLKVLTLRLLWLNLESVEGLAKISGMCTPTTPSRSSRLWTGPALSSRASYSAPSAPATSAPGAPATRQPSRSPGPPRCANILPARYRPGAFTPEPPPRGRTCWGEGRSWSPRPAPTLHPRPSQRPPRTEPSPRPRSPRTERSPWSAGSRSGSRPRPSGLTPSGTAAEAAPAEVHVRLEVSPARLAAAEAKRIAEAPHRPKRSGEVEAEMVNQSTARMEETSRECMRKSSTGLFKVDLDLGGGVVAPITVHEETDLQAASAEVVQKHGLSKLEGNRITKYLQRLREEVQPKKAETTVSTRRRVVPRQGHGDSSIFFTLFLS